MYWGDRIQDANSVEAIRRHARWCEEAGMAAMWSSEAGRDPYLPIVVASEVTDRLLLGTGIAVAYGRTPYATAQVAWDLQRLTSGRFRLGIATQVRAHIERRYGTAWPGGTPALREYLECCRAIWDCWQHGTKPQFEGRWYQFTLTNPEFRPEPLHAAYAHIPLWVAAVGKESARMAGELADGLHVHAFHTPGYLRDVVLAAADEGRAQAGRPGRIQATSPVFAGVVHDEKEERTLRLAFREHIAFYASTPAYAKVLEFEGLRELHEELAPMAREGRWGEMAEVVDDGVVDRFAIFDEPVRLADRLHERYDGLLTELALYRGGDQFASPRDMRQLLDRLSARRRADDPVNVVPL